MMKRRAEPPKAFVAGLGSAKSAKRSNRDDAMKALATVKANSKKKEVDKRPYKKEWWMIYQPPAAGSCIFNLGEEAPWHSLIAEDAGGKEVEVRKLDKGSLESLSNRVVGVFTEEVNKYEKARKRSASSEGKWMDDMIKAGTFSDKVAAMALRIQESPIHQLDTLDALIHLADKSEQRAANIVLEAIKDLFTHNLLPDRPLVRFEQRQLGAKNLTMESAMLYYFEGKLLERVQRVVNILEKGLRGTLEYFKKQCMEMVMVMLASKPEQEKRLLTLLVGKMSDQTGNVTSKCIELLKSLMKQHPAMKEVIVREIHDLIFRDAVSMRTVYNGIVFLSQVPLSSGENRLAAILVEGYIVIFEKAVSKEEMRARLMAALLTGINKAFPFLKDASAVAKHTDELFRIAHGDSFSSATQALTLLSHIALNDSDGGGKGGDGESELQTRFYRALYSRLLSNQILTRTRNTLFLNLLFRSIKRDSCDERCGAFVKRLAICATNSGANISAGHLLLVSEVMKARPALANMLIRKETGVDVVKDEHVARDRFGPYDASKREPKYAAPSLPSLWEASLMRHHAHPSVSRFADSLLEAPHAIQFNGDPTVDFTLSAFLNRFAFKNPKQRDSQKIRRALPTPEQPLNTNTEEFVSAREADVDADKRFFHRYFGQRSRLRQEGQSRDRSAKRKGSDLDMEDDDEEEEDAFGEPAMSGSEGSDDEVESGLSEAEDDEDRGEDEVDDDEAAIDRYADRLAEQLMKAHADGDDPDMDDFSSDEGGDSNGEDAEDRGTGKSESEGDSDSEGDDVDFSQAAAERTGTNGDFDSESDDYDAPQIGGSSDYDDQSIGASEEGEFDEPIAKTLKRKGENGRKHATKSGEMKKARMADDDNTFASYTDYEGMMSKIMDDIKTREKSPVDEKAKARWRRKERK